MSTLLRAICGSCGTPIRFSEKQSGRKHPCPRCKATVDLVVAPDQVASDLPSLSPEPESFRVEAPTLPPPQAYLSPSAPPAAFRDPRPKVLRTPRTLRFPFLRAIGIAYAGLGLLIVLAAVMAFMLLVQSGGDWLLAFLQVIVALAVAIPMLGAKEAIDLVIGIREDLAALRDRSTD